MSLRLPRNTNIPTAAMTTSTPSPIKIFFILCLPCLVLRDEWRVQRQLRKKFASWLIPTCFPFIAAKIRTAALRRAAAPKFNALIILGNFACAGGEVDLHRDGAFVDQPGADTI
jgi:hypothetical protein